MEQTEESVSAMRNSEPDFSQLEAEFRELKKRIAETPTYEAVARQLKAIASAAPAPASSPIVLISANTGTPSSHADTSRNPR